MATKRASADAAEAEGAEMSDTEAAATPEKPAKEPRPDGDFTTRNGSQAKVEKGRTFTAGGPKGAAIAALLKEGKLTRKQIAEQVGCSQSRVAEVAKVLGMQTRIMTPQVPAEAAAE